jgi:superfamily II DNA or RNA helicase
MAKKDFYSFEDARKFVHGLDLKGIEQYYEYTKSDDFPDFLPKRPESHYKGKGWDGATDWVGGTRIKYETGSNLLPFLDAREFVRNLGLKSQKQWEEYSRSDDKPNNIPAAPQGIYKKVWRGHSDWLGLPRTKGGNFRSYNDAREYARSLGFSNRKQWQEFKESNEFPYDIPKKPDLKFKGKGWTSWPDWLNFQEKESFLSFNDASKLLIKMKISSNIKFIELGSKGQRPKNIPSMPKEYYKNEWKGWLEFLGKEQKGGITGMKKDFLSFEDAREFVVALDLKGNKEWREYSASGKRPDNIPGNPESCKEYMDEWRGYPYWIGTSNTSIKRTDSYLEFNESKKYAQSLGLKNKKDWKDHTKLKNFPKKIPANPGIIYSEFAGYGDWLGVILGKKYDISFEKAREIVRVQKFTSQKEFKKWYDETKPDIPKQPFNTYEEEWTGWPDFLGKEEKVKKLPYIEAREYVRKKKFPGQKEFLAWVQSDENSGTIPSTPSEYYKGKGWIGLSDWLGTTRTKRTDFLSFNDARKIARGLNISGMKEWDKLSREHKLPIGLHSQPAMKYPHEWKNWYDWLGNEDSSWSTVNVKELLRDLIKSGSIWHMDEADLYAFLLEAGALHTQAKHKDFFQNLIQASRTNEGRKLIEEYAKSESSDPPKLSGLKINANDPEAEIGIVDNDQLLKNDKKDPINKNHLQSVKEILLETRILKIFDNNEKIKKYYFDKSIRKLWKRAFNAEPDDLDKMVTELKNQKDHENIHEKLVADAFLDEYRKTVDLPMPKNYKLKNPANQKLMLEPFLMQRYVAYKVKNLKSFGNFSGPGAGKTLSALIASRTIDSKLTLILCPLDTIQNWRDYIENSFSESKIIFGKSAFNVKRNEEKFQYLVVNYDKFNQNNSSDMVLKLAHQKIDFVVLDELHWAKQTTPKGIKKRRENLEILLSNARKKNPEIKILGLSATPVVNNLQEGISLLQLMTGDNKDHLKPRDTVPNAVKIYQELSKISIRQIPEYKEPLYTTSYVDIDSLTDEQKQFLTNKPMAMEQILTDVRLPEIIKRIDGQTIIYTEYLGTDDPSKQKIIDKIQSAVELADFSCGLFVGKDKSGLDKFKKKEIQVLIASKPISTGIDGLQKICNNLIFNTLPWTNAQYIQTIGRLVRTGQEKEVKIHHILAGFKIRINSSEKDSLRSYPYDELKMGRINYKRTLADCAVDGKLPEAKLITPSKVNSEAVKWLNRLVNT